MSRLKNKLKVYSLDHLKPEVVAVAFAKCSRSPESFKKIADELTDEKSSDFHEKWVVGYGHSSVAEHATLHLAIENVSILATKIIEDNRLGSYTEKSTRYQVFDRNKYYKPETIIKSKYGREYTKTMDQIYDTYTRLHHPMNQYITSNYPKKKNQTDKLYQVITKARVCDNLRYLLPTATLTNLGMTANARTWEHAIVKLSSHPLTEARHIGLAIKKAALEITPTLIKFADKNNYIQKTNQELEKIEYKIKTDKISPSHPVEIVDYDKQAEKKLAACLLYKHSDLPYKQIYSQVKKMNSTQIENIIDIALKHRTKYDQPVREFENIYYTFDILMDYGAFRDIQRHRMCTQTNQKVTIVHGYEIPTELKSAGIESDYRRVMDQAASLFFKLSDDYPNEAQYVVPLAFRKRTLFTWNLRELHHFISLRSTPKGHISYRKIAQACWQKLNQIQPLLAKYIRVSMSGGSDSWASTMFNPEYNYMPKHLKKK